FAGSSSAVISAAILDRDPVAPRSRRPEIPPRLEDIILKLLDKDRDMRCQTAAELRADLKRLRREISPAAASRLDSPTGAAAGVTHSTDAAGAGRIESGPSSS